MDPSDILKSLTAQLITNPTVVGSLQLFSQDPQNVIQLGYGMEAMVFKISDTHFFFNDIEVRSDM